MYDEIILESLSHGEERLDYLKKCIADADKEKNIKMMLELRHDYIQESVFHDDAFKAIVMFPEFMKLFDENPNVISVSSFMFPFKWILENTAEHYQVSLEQLEKYFERFKEYIEKFGFTMRTYYLKKYQIYEHIDHNKALAAFREYKKYDRTEISDCRACEENSDARHEMRFGSEKKAVAMLNSMLDRNMRCAEVPQVSYGAFVREFTKRGMYEEAEHYADLFMPMIKGDEVNYMDCISYVLILRSMTNISDAIDIFCRCAGIYSKLKNPSFKFWFAYASSFFFEGAVKNEVEELHLKLSSDFELHNAEGIYKTRELQEYFRKTAQDLADKYDKRNGTDYYNEIINYEYPDAPEKKIVLPAHGNITPEPFVLGVLFKSIENFPDVEQFIPELEKKLGFEDSRLQAMEDNGQLYYYATTKNNEQARYRIVFTDEINLEGLSCNHYIPEEKMENIEEYKVMAVIIPDVINPDRYEEMERMIKFADILNKDDSPVVLGLSCQKLLSSDWVAMTALSDAPPKAENFYRFKLFASAFEEGKADVMTVGLNSFGSRELVITSVDQDDIEFTAAFTRKIAEELTIRPLLDEGIKMNSGIVYDNRSYVRFSWESVRFPDDEGNIDDEAEVFAEPIVFLSSSHEGKRIVELTEDERNATFPRKHNKISAIDEKRCKNLFPYALDYFRNNECSVIVGVNQEGIDEDGDPTESFIFAELTGDGKYGEVRSFGEDVPDIQEGDEVEIKPEDVYYFRIETDEDTFEADELYIIYK